MPRGRKFIDYWFPKQIEEVPSERHHGANVIKTFERKRLEMASEHFTLEGDFYQDGKPIDRFYLTGDSFSSLSLTHEMFKELAALLMEADVTIQNHGNANAE